MREVRGLRTFAILSAVLVAVAVAAGVGRDVAAAQAQTACVGLRATPELRAQLSRTHSSWEARSGSSVPVTGALGRVYVGRCGATEWALAGFMSAQLGFQDQPEMFERVGASHWHDLGDTGGDVAANHLPRQLLGIWHYRNAWGSIHGSFVASDSTTLESRPASLLLSADGTFYVTSLRWSSWGKPTAQASGKVWTTNCKPDCAGSPRISHSGTVRLLGVASCDGNNYYTKAAVSWTNSRGRHAQSDASFENPCSSQG